MLIDDLRLALPKLEFKENESLAPHTTLKIGGPAEVLTIVTKQSQLFELLKYIHQYPNTTFNIFGLGSNVVISDSGLPGLTIINRASKVTIFPKVYSGQKNFQVTYTQRGENEPEKYLDFTKLDYDESGLPTQEVQIQTGTPLATAINQLLNAGLTGLQWFAYIPGTVGGAVFQNIHGGRYHFSDFIISVKAFNLKTGKSVFFQKSDLNWKYETSPFQSQPELVILSVRLRLFKGDAALGKKVVASWIAQKSLVQPLNSAGSCFANPPLDICQKIWGEQKSAGWIIDHELGLKGYKFGGVQISEKHSNFLVNANQATATDYKKLVELVQSKVQEKFGFTLTPEVRFLGKF